MSAITRRGAFILFEGLDRCGKTTQSALLAEFVKAQRPAELIRFPDRTSSIGQLINGYLSSATNLNDQTIHLLFSANRWEASKELEEKLLSGCTLICDRYAYSGVAFSAAKGMDVDWCKSCDNGLPAPDVIIYLDMPVEDAAKRGQFGEERYEKVEFQMKVREEFFKLRAADEGKINWQTIDASRSIQEIQAQIQEISMNVLQDSENNDIVRLWG
jgi:dTMP kinase